MSKGIVRVFATLGIVMMIWAWLTFWVDSKGSSKLQEFTSPDDSLSVLLVYDPDPIYNLDEQICISIAKGLNEQKVNATVATVKATNELKFHQYSAVVICANTYNWAPDDAVVAFIQSNEFLKSVPVVAVTIGSGTTSQSAARLKELLHSRKIELLNDHEWWLMRPNDESRLEEKNVDVAKDQAFAFGERIANQLIARSK